jgi:hypothetical protein
MARRYGRVAGWSVMKAKCATCPFGPNGDRLIEQAVTETMVRMEGSQICHHPVLKGKRETHLCRGARDLQLRLLAAFGVIDDATDEAFTAKGRKLGVLGGGKK